MTFKKKKMQILKIFLSLFISIILSCKSNDLEVRKINAKIINIDKNQEANKEVEDIIKPYSKDVDEKMNAVLCYNPTPLEKKKINNYQNDIGNWMADVVFDFTNKTFEKKYNKKLDICLLNAGGVRAILPAGNVTTRNAFEIMPFENEVVVLELSGEVIKEIADYIIIGQKPHPMKGMIIEIEKEKIKTIKVGGILLDLNKKYYVATNDYLANGGDNMNFFKKNTQKYVVDYKIRNLLIDYFKSVKQISYSKDIRVKN